MHVTPEQVRAAMTLAIKGAKELAAKTQTKVDDALIRFAEPILLSDLVINAITNWINAQIDSLITQGADVSAEEAAALVRSEVEKVVAQHFVAHFG